MKKNLLLVLAIVLVVAFSLVLTVACDKTEHTHDFGDAYTITVEPTETTKGKATHKCECGDIEEVEIPALTDSVWTKSTTDATCSAEGSSVYTSVYGKVTVTIGKLNHTEVIDAAVEATCTTAGKTEGKHCSVCNTVIVAQEDVPAKGHTEVIDAAVAATCTETGLTEGKHCSVCNEVLVAQETVAALGHTEVVDAAVAPTCTETGLTEGKHCSVCNEVLVAQEVVDALGHTEETIPGKAPTCTETGLTDGVKCSVCGEILTAQEEIPATGHTEVVDAAVAPTCTETGLTEGKHCSVCGEVLVAQEVVDALGHNYDDVGHCDRCGLTDPTKCEHPTFAHTEAKAPTCTENGNIEYWTCEGCATIYSDEAHTVVVTAEDLVVAATGHTEVVDDAVAPTCTETGLTAGSHCSVCGEVIVAQEVVDALGHTEETIPGTPATCTEAGISDGVKCSVCGEIITAQEEIPALGHDIVANECSRCDFGYTVEEVLEMTYALESGKSLKGTYKLTGIVTVINTAYSSQYKNVTVTIAVEGNEETQIQLYRLKGEGVDTLAVGDIVTAVGPIKNYNGTFEMDVPTVAVTPDLVKVTYQQSALTLDVTETQVSFVLPAGNIASVEWSVKEANPALTVDGFNATVTPQAEDATVVLVATITSGSVTTNKEFIVVVPKLASTPADKVADVKESLTFTANTWYKNGTYTLPVVDTYDDVTVAWTVDCAYATIADGVLTVTIDELTEDITTVVTATITCEDVTDTATYDVAIYGTVLGRAYCLADGEYLGGSNSSKYTLTGVVSEIDTAYNSQYKNISVVIIIDGNEEKPLLLFRLSGTGVENIKVGDTVSANGPIKNYKGTVEMDCPVKVLTDADHAQSEVDALTVPTEVDASFTLPTAAQGTTAWAVVTDTTAITVDGVNATVTRGAEDVVVTLRATVTVGEAVATKDFEVKVIKEGGVAVPETTVNFVVADYAAANSWEDTVKYTSATVDSNVSISIVGGGNTGKYYTNGQNWRMYQADTPSVIISAAEGNTILSVKVTYASQNTGSLTLNGANVASGTVVDVNASSITFSVGNTGSATNGQARITAIEIVYVTVGGGETPDVCEHTNTTEYEAVVGTCIQEGFTAGVYCNDCEQYISGHESTGFGDHVNTVEVEAVESTCTVEGFTAGVYCNDCETYVSGHESTGFADHVDEDEDDVCDNCGASLVAPSTITASKSIADLITSEGWTSSTTKQTFKLDENVTVTVGGGANSGKAYTDHIRIYASDTPAGSLTISVPEGYELVSVNVATLTGNYAYLYVGEGTTDISNVETAISGQTVVLNTVKKGTDGKQVRVTGITVTYKVAGGGETPDVCEHANTTYHEVVEPTCTTDGCLDYYSCDDCGKLFADEACTEEVTLEDLVVAGGHSYGELSVGFAATCTSEGMIDFYQCSVCHTYFDADKNALENEDALIIPVVPHSYGELVEAVEPTCDSEGLHAHYECSVCHKVFDVDKVETTEEDLFIPVDATKHTYGDLIPAQDPTCTEDGWYAYYECACGKLFDIDKVETTLEEIYREAGHTVVVDAAVAPSCTETGLTEGSHCSVCNEVFVAQEVVDALGHTPVVDAAVAPSCTETGLTEGSHCSVCGEVLVAQEVVAATGHSHVFVDFATEPTLDEAGVANFACACGDATTEEVPALSDTETWTEGETVAPDYNNAGSTVYTSDVYGEVTVAVAKLVAPYDNKTYSPVAFEAVEEEEKNRVLTPVLSWNSFVATFGPDGKVTDPDETSFMFRGAAITMVDPLTGEISYATSSSTYKGFVDMTTGIIVKAHTGNALNYVNLLTPFEVEASAESFSASTWNDRMAIVYTYGENVYNIYVTDTRVYFGVSFTDIEGNAIAGNACYLADYLYVKDSAGNLIDSFGYTAEVGMEALDGYEGTYNGALGQVFLNGRGIINLVAAPSVVGTYTIVDDADYTAEVILGGKFLTVTIDGEGNYVAEEHNSDITFAVNNAEYTESVAPVTIALNIPYELPDLGTTATKVFLGWYIEDATQLITSITPTEPAYILNAKWGDLCVVTLVGVPEGVETTHYLAVGTVVTDVLPELPEVEDKVFAGWFADEEYTIPVEGLAIDAGMTEVTIFARYDDLAPYVGTYYGVEIWNASYGNSSMKTMTIDANGNISGLKTGIIESYDPATQTVTWKTSAEATSVNKFYFDPETDVIAGIYNSTEIGNDFYFLSKNFTAENFKVTAHYGVKAPKEPGSSSIGWYAHFINDGTNNIFLYNNHVYANPTITDVAGNTLAVADVQNSKTVVVHHNDVMVIAIASQGDSFTANNNTNILEAPFGTFTCEGEEDLVLDGTGKFTWGENAGTYTANGEAYDLYTVVDGVNVAYHTVTLDGTTYTATKPFATINFVVGDGHDAVESVSLNYNVPATLPTPADTETHIFRGWYLDDPANAVYTFTATESEYTFTAKWDVKVSLTVVYGKGIDNAVLYYAVGETTAPVEPEYTDGQVFDHWYTSADEGVTETAVYTPGAITENTVIYCAWADPEPWFNTYYTVSMGWSVSTSYATKALTVAPNGVGTFTSTSGSTPFYPNSTVTISYLDKEAGKVLFTEVYNYEEEDWYGDVTTYAGTRYFWGIIDPETGIIVRCTTHASSVDALSDTFGFTFYVMIPETVVSENVKGGRFEEASDSTDHVVFSYTFADASVCTIYLTDTNAYFGASVESEDGTAIEDINNIDTAATIYVYDREDNLIVCFANNGSDKFVALDGYQGTYTNPLGDVVADGHGGFVLGGTHVGTYTFAVDADYTVDAYIAEGAYAGYYEITLDKVNGTYTLNKPMVTVSYNVGEVTPIEGAPADVTVNKNVAYTLPVLTSESHIFRGWFADAECTEAIGETYAPSATGTIYAKWDAKLTLTVVYGNGLDNAVLYYGAGDTTAPVAPAFTNGKEFDHWYTSDDEGVTETAVYTPGAITENTVIYCAWKDSLASAGAYMGFNLYGTGTDKTQTSFTTNVLTINADGTYTGRETGTLTEEQKLVVDGAVTLEGSYFYINTYANAVWTNYSKDKADVGNDTYFGIRGNVSKLECSRLKYNTSYLAAWVTVYYADETTANIFLYNNRIYDNVTWTEGVTALKASAAAKVLTYDKNGDLIVACFAGTFKEMDAYVGDYANGENTLTLDGFGGLTITDSTLAFDGATGTYTVASDADYTLDATIDGTNYEITLAEGAYTIVKPVFTVHFDTDELVEVEDQTVNKGAKFTLPEVENPEGFKFAGWYEDAELTSKIYSAFAITEETTIYAKWEVSVTVTFDFLGGGDNVTLDTYYTNDTVASADIPAPTTFGDKVFVGWYTLNGTETDDWGTTFTSSTKLTTDTTVYAKWILPVATMGSYKGFEIWGSTSTSTGKTFEVSATGVATGSKSGTITDYDAETGKFVLVNGSSRYNGHYDVATGTIAINYGTSTAGLGNDTWVFVKDVTTVAIDKANSANWNNKYTRVATITVDEVDRVIFIYDGKVYGNVTVTALDGEGNAIADYASYATAASLTVANATDASVIANFKHDGADLVGLDGFEGTYVPSEGEATDVGTIVVDGVGTITAGENNYAYTVVNGSLVTVINNQTRVFFVLDGEYVFDQDGVQGDYDSVDGGDIYTFDGYGNWTALEAETSGTYVVNGASITLYETGAEEGVTYGLGDGALLGKTIFAGLTFTGTYYSEWDEMNTTLKVVFDDSSEISGVIYSGNGTSYYFNFTGVMEGNTLTLTITSAVDSSQVGKTITFTVSNQTLTVASTTMTSNVYTFDNNGSATCESFTYGA